MFHCFSFEWTREKCMLYEDLFILMDKAKKFEDIKDTIAFDRLRKKSRLTGF